MGNSELSKYYEEHSEQITKMSTKKSFRDGVEAEEKAIAYIKKMQEKGQNIQEIAKKFKITPYMYYNDFRALNQTQTELTKECEKNFNEKIVSDALKKDEKVNNVDEIATKFYSESQKSKSDYNTMCELFTQKQDEAILHAINQQSLADIHLKDANILNKELEQIKGRTSIEKIKDVFKGQSKVKKERAAEIERALDIINKRIESDKDIRNNPLMPKGKLAPEQVVVNLDKARSIAETANNFASVQKYNEMIEHIRMNYSVDYKKVNEMINVDKNQLPQIAGKNVKITEKQKMDYFLHHQGYTEGSELSGDKSNSGVQPLDPFKTWNISKIKSIEKRIPNIKEIGKMLQTGKSIESKEQVNEQTQKPFIKGAGGDGFSIVR